jgi:hypothetical protein
MQAVSLQEVTIGCAEADFGDRFVPPLRRGLVATEIK